VRAEVNNGLDAEIICSIIGMPVNSRTNS